MIAIDKLCYASKLRRKNGTVKFTYTMLTLLICAVSRSSPAAAVVLLVNAFLTIRIGGVRPKRYLHFMMVPLAFLLLSTLAIAVNIEKNPQDLFAVPLGSFYLTGSKAGLFYALQLILTALSCVSCLYFLSMTTPIPDILNVLRKLHCPQLLSELMLLIYRYIFILLDTAGNILTAQQCRLGYKDFRTSLTSFAALASALMLRAISRSKALYTAMEARCYDGSIRVLSEEQPPKVKDIVMICLFELLLILIACGRLF